MRAWFYELGSEFEGKECQEGESNGDKASLPARRIFMGTGGNSLKDSFTTARTDSQ